MAESVKITGNLADGTPISLSLDGASTQRQMERLIKLVAEMTAKITKGNSDLAKQELQEIKNTKDHNEQLKESVTNQKNLNKGSLSFEDALDDLKTMSYKLQGGFLNLLTSSKNTGSFIAGMGVGLVKNLFDYSDKMGEGLKRGVAGDVMDFAVSAKTAGVDMTTFTKALDESGGGFVMLGNGATEGAKNFAALAGEVRQATSSVGNLGMTNAENAIFAAQQLKVAVAQGYKDRQARDVVIRNTRELGKEFDDLAARTGKNVMEMAQSAMKLAQDPLVASFVRSAGLAGKTISVEIQKLAANFKGIFGEAGDKMAGDLAKSAMSGLPFAVTQSGKNMLMASSAVYSEMDRQAQLIKNGGKLDEADRERLRNVVLQEVDARGDQLRTMAMLEGPAGDSARAILEMANEAQHYNDADRVLARKREQTAKDFNASVRDMQANLMALSIPFLKLINGVNWTFFIDILNGFATVLGIVLKPLAWLGEILGDTGLGSVIGGLLALATAGSLLVAGFGVLGNAVRLLTVVIQKAAMTAGLSKTGAVDIGDMSGWKSGPTASKGPAGETRKSGNRLYKFGYQMGEFVGKFSTGLKFATVALGGLAVSALGASMLEDDADSVLGKTLEVVGTGAEILGTWIPIVSWLAGEFPILGTALATTGATLAKWGGALTKSITGLFAEGGLLSSLGPWIARTGASLLSIAETALTAVGPWIARIGASLLSIAETALTAVGPMIVRAGAFLLTSLEGAVAGIFGAGGLLATVGAGLVEAGAFMMGGLEVVLGGAAAVLAGISAPVWGTIAAVAALGAGIYFFWDDIKEAGSWILDGTEKLWKSVTGMFGDLGSWMSDGTEKLWNGITGMFGDLGSWMSDGATNLWNGMTDGMMGMFSDLGSWMSDGAKNLWNSMTDGMMGMFSDLGSWMSDGAKNLWKSVTGMFGDLGSWITKMFTNMFGDLGSWMSDWWSNLWGGSSSSSSSSSGSSTTNLAENSPNINTDIVTAQATVIDQKAAKDTENQRQMNKQTNLLEELVASNSAQINIQSRTASLQDDSNKYLRTASLASA